MTESGEPSVVVLKRKWKADGHKGKLIADDTGIAIASSRIKRTKTKGFWSKSTHEQIFEQPHYLARWADVTNIDITQPETKNFAGSTINADNVDLVVDTASNHLMFDLKYTSTAKVNNQLGPYIAQVRNRRNPN
jgi:hypothetical protein